MVPRKTRMINIVNPPQHRKWTPLLVFANTKSGNGLGKKVLAECSKVLHPLQVHDLSRAPPQSTLNILKALPKQRFSILCCGGDGTVNWIFNALDEIKPETEPYVAVLPLGTGNDISRVLNWGPGYTHFDCVRSTLASLVLSQPVKLDRWTAQITYDPEKTPVRKYALRNKTPTLHKNVAFQNYFSIGTDAATMLDFHHSRESAPLPIFSMSRTINKFWIGLMAFKNIIDNSRMKDLHKKMKLILDEIEYKIPPEIECILFLNVWSWGGGISVWRNGLVTENGASDQSIGKCTKKPLTQGSMSDGMIEVLGFTGGIHLGEVRINIREPVRLGQCRSAKLKILTTLPFQADGEAWLNQPGVVDIVMNQPRMMLLNKADEYFKIHAENEINKKKIEQKMASDAGQGDFDSVAGWKHVIFSVF